MRIAGLPVAMAAALTNALTRIGPGSPKTSDLPNPVLIAVGPTTVYAFKYKPRGFKVKVKSGSEVARWPRKSLTVEAGTTGKVSQFALVTDENEVYALEVTTMMGGAGAYDLFIQSLLAPVG